ncbi:MAG: hypothetical protein LIP08_03050 [Bacteroides sp.]|nr:hypothetical protein [Bacteroides sp.]
MEAGKGLSANDFTAAYKTRLDSAVVPTVDVHTVTSLASLPVNKYNIKCTYSSSTPTAISFASTPAEGFECILSILNSTSADITQAIPNATGWQSEEDSITLPAGEVTEISIRYIHGKYIVRT